MEEINETTETEASESTTSEVETAQVETAEPEEERIPLSRLNAALEKAREAKKEANTYKQRLADYEKQIEELKGSASMVESLNKQIKELEAGIKAKEAAWATEKQLMNSGLLDEEGREIARFYYDRFLEAPEGGEKPGMLEWIASLKEEGAEIPPALRPFLQPSSETPTAVVEQPPKKMPNSNAHVKPTNAVGSSIKAGVKDPEWYKQPQNSQAALENYRRGPKRLR